MNRSFLAHRALALPRAIYTCRRLGVRAISLVTAPFTGPLAATARWREHPARWLAWWQLTVTHPRPRFLGPPETALDDGAVRP